MKLVLATSNKGKLQEIKELCSEHEVMVYSELIDEFEIVEDGSSFKQNALIKARAVFKALKDESVVVIADDSGISVDELGGEPNIYSARYAGVDANDKDNLLKVVDELKKREKTGSPAHYTAAIAIVNKDGEFCVHGWMYGDVITTPRGDKGFGYDPIFIPKGYEKTLGELESSVKKEFSHRSKALKLAKIILREIAKE
ncbi:MAG: RdgB/HAM1 family non-canonical purine NTP pyrophosphatase [Sulfurimonas sp.]|jgi:XTP/dITP diphosphohydrolase|nr:RdgB/HAM1 family non-canonical purine NTP pyrophosphatase [Sulfurimonadaceae bacterium]